MEEKKTFLQENLKKIFIIFLILHVIVWSLLPLIRQILPIDAMECVYWGGLIDLGTNKHPPLAGWIAYIVYNLLGKSDFLIYLLGQVSIIVGFIYLYRLGKLFLTEIKALLSVMVMEACFVYTYMGIYDGFNPNFLLLAFLPMITFYFYKSIHYGKVWDWIKLGIFVGLSFLAKYQTLMLFIPLFAYLIVTPSGRKQFKTKNFYIAVFVAFAIFLPHIIWLYNHKFFSLNYFLICEERYASFYSGSFKYLWAPIAFLFNQFVAISGVLFIYFTALLFSKEKIGKEDQNADDKKFLIFAGIIPVLLQSLNGLNGNYMIPQWGYSLLFMSGILLFYFFPFKISDRVIKYIVSWVFAAMFITFIVLLIVFATEKNFANRFPVSQVTNTLYEIYKSETGRDMKYIGGFIELSIPLPNPWINDTDLKESGAIVIGRNRSYMDEYIDVTAPTLDQKPEVKQFKFTVKSAVNRKREYKMFYAIILPNANYK